MTEYDVKEIIRKREEEKSPSPFGCILILAVYGLFFYLIHVAGEDYKHLKERVEQLEAQVQKDGK